MRRRSWIGLIGALAAIAAIVSLTVVPAIADDGDDTSAPAPAERCEQFLGKVADNLDMSVDQLTGAMTDARLEMIDEAVADGLISEECAAQIRQRVEENGGVCGLMGRGPRGHGPGPMGCQVLDAAVESGIITQEQADAIDDLREETRAQLQEQMQESFGERSFGERGFGGRCRGR